MRLIEPDDVLSHTPRGTYRPTLPSPDSKRSNCLGTGHALMVVWITRRYGTGKMKHDIQSEILPGNLSSFLKLSTHPPHLKMDVHNWCPIYISMSFAIDTLL